jgi:hypothetical protein
LLAVTQGGDNRITVEAQVGEGRREIVSATLIVIAAGDHQDDEQGGGELLEPRTRSSRGSLP